MAKTLIFTFLFISSTLGGFIPMLWGDSGFSPSSILFSTLGGFIGIYVGYQIGNRFE